MIFGHQSAPNTGAAATASATQSAVPSAAGVAAAFNGHPGSRSPRLDPHQRTAVGGT